LKFTPELPVEKPSADAFVPFRDESIFVFKA
jgi:hypothetical protein